MKNLRIYQLIHRDLTGQLSHSEETELNTYKTQSEYDYIFAELSMVWSASKNYFPQHKFDVNAAKARFAKRIAQDKKPAKTVTMPWLLTAVAAAVVIIFVAWWSIANLSGKTKTITAKEAIEYAVLPDQSEVWLSQGTTLSFAKFEQGAARTVTLDGEAYFMVESVAETPFILDIGNNNYVEVLGTAFNVKTDIAQGKAEVRVNEGIVKMYNASIQDLDVTLYPGESASLDTESGSIVPFRHESSYSFFSDQLNFKNAPLPVVFDKLASFFDVTFKYDRGSLSACLVNSPLMDDFGLEEIFAVLEGLFPELTISKSGKSSYRVSGLECTR